MGLRRARAEAGGHGMVTLQAAGSPDERLRCAVAAVWSLRDHERFAELDHGVWEQLARRSRGRCERFGRRSSVRAHRRSLEDQWLSNRYAATSSSPRAWAS